MTWFSSSFDFSQTFNPFGLNLVLVWALGRAHSVFGLLLVECAGVLIQIEGPPFVPVKRLADFFRRGTLAVPLKAKNGLGLARIARHAVVLGVAIEQALVVRKSIAVTEAGLLIQDVAHACRQAIGHMRLWVVA